MEYLRDITLSGKCYIYPSGGCAQAVVNILRDCFVDLEFVMLDDSVEKTSLEAFYQEIQESGSYLLLCAGDVYEELLIKCEKLNLLKVVDGRAYTAMLLASKIKREAKRDDKKFEFLEDGRLLHIFDNPWIAHLYYFWDLFSYYLDDEVFRPLREAVFEYCESMGLQEYLRIQKGIMLGCSRDLFNESFSLDVMGSVVVYCGSLEFYQRMKHKLSENYQILCCHWVLLDYFINRGVFFVSGSLLFNFAKRKTKVVKVGCGHSLCDAFHLSPKGQKLKYLTLYVQRYFSGFDYYLAIDKVSKGAFEKMFKQCRISTKILEAGSLSLDVKNICFSDEVDSFMFIPRLNGAECVEVIRELLSKEKKVVFRPHPAYLSYSKQYKIPEAYGYLKDFLCNENFSMDFEERINQELLARSIVITDNSSLSYSAPLSTLRPCVLFAPPKKEFDVRMQNFGISFSNPALHCVANNAQECVEVALKLESTLVAGGGQELREKILQYRENIYNVGCAREVILGILKEMVENAESSFCY